MGTSATFNTDVLNLGLFSQVGTVVLLVVLFVLLRRQALRRPYFRAWTNAWIALAVALLAVLVRYDVLPRFLGAGSHGRWWVELISLVYQFGKLAFLLLLLQGILVYLTGARHLRLTRALWGALAAFTLLSVLLSHSSQALLFWQGLCNLGVYGFGALLLLTLPVPRRSLGTRVMGTILGATGAIWVVYLLGLAPAVLTGTPGHSGLQMILQGPNNYLDLVFGMMLAFGMVLVLFEDVRSEIDTAHRELRVAHEQLLREVYLDTLTGAYNRRALAEGAGLEYAKGSFGVVVVLDMDNLKAVNDHYGHKHGDALLRHLVAVLRQGLRPSDKLYRVGGDEFLIVMPGAVPDATRQRITEILATAPALRLEDSSTLIELHASIGAASFASVNDIQSATYAADRSMYANKRTGRSGAANPASGLAREP
ncbi:MAG: GGDEF domain-containing protein [Gammaproteobacteria bacterium]